MVSVELATCPFTTTFGGLNEHTGGIVTSGVIELHDSVIPAEPAGLEYPLIGLMFTVPSPPLPAGTLLGLTGAVVMVNWGVTASTVRLCGWVLVVCPVEGAVPVMVIE